MRWSILINPAEYDDADDNGFATAVEADTEEEAVELAIQECEACNDWEEGRINRDRCVLFEATPDYRYAFEQLKKRVLAIDAKITKPEGDGSEDRPPTGDDYNDLYGVVAAVLSDVKMELGK